MTKKGRHYFGEGVAIQRRGTIWWLDFYRSGKRIRRSLETSEMSYALMAGNALIKQIRIRRDCIALADSLSSMPKIINKVCLDVLEELSKGEDWDALDRASCIVKES